MSILIKNAVVVTMDAKETIIPNGGVIVTDNRIENVYAGTAPHDNYDDVIDAQNHVLMPGFINLHTHSVTNALRGESGRIWGNHARHEDLFAFCGGLTPTESYAFAKLFICESIRFGCTTFVDGTDFADSVAQAALDTGIRCFLAGGRIHDQNFGAPPEAADCFDAALGQKTLRQTVAFLEKWEHKNERIQGMFYPYSASACSPALWREIAALAAQTNKSITTHLAQSTLEVQRVKELYQKTCVAYLADFGVLNERFIGADGVFLNEEDCQILAARRAHVAHNAAANALHGQMAPLCQMIESRYQRRFGYGQLIRGYGEGVTACLNQLAHA